MTNSPLVSAIVSRLREAGYESLASPFRVATVEFDFTAVMRGKRGRAMDLVLVVDTTTGAHGDIDAARVRHRVEALSRALDVTGSRYLITVILAGAALADSVEALSETCRVLRADELPPASPGQGAFDVLDDRIRVLLPLQLPHGTQAGGDTDLNLHDQLMRSLGQGVDLQLFELALAASEQGELAVTEAVAQRLGGTLRAKDNP